MLNKPNKIAGLAAGLMIAATPAAGKGMLEQAYSDAWKDAKSVQYAEPTPRELSAAQRLFVRLLRGESAQAIASEAHAMGWEVHSHIIGPATWSIMSEKSDQRKGRGLFAFSSRGRHALQAPHVPSDGLTGQILLKYARDGLPRALAWNTVPRKTADLAHLDATYLIAFSQAFAQVHPSEKILQLHGFDGDKRRSNAAAESEAIISAGHKNPSSELKHAVQCMKRKVEEETRLYGVDVQELGGTTNSIVRAMRRSGYEGFVHVELAMSLREDLAENSGQRRAMFECLGGTQ